MLAPLVLSFLLAPHSMHAAPQLTAPQLTAPQRTAPQLTAPQRTTPQLITPHLTAPQLITPHLTAPQLITADPATQLAMQLCLERVKLVERETLYQAEHPLLEQQQRLVAALEKSLATLRDQGHQVDEQRVDAMLDALLQRTTAEWDVAQQELTSSHPRLALLELRLESLGCVAARRALAD